MCPLRREQVTDAAPEFDDVHRVAAAHNHGGREGRCGREATCTRHEVSGLMADGHRQG